MRVKTDEHLFKRKGISMSVLKLKFQRTLVLLSFLVGPLGGSSFISASDSNLPPLMGIPTVSQGTEDMSSRSRLLRVDSAFGLEAPSVACDDPSVGFQNPAFCLKPKVREGKHGNEAAQQRQTAIALYDQQKQQMRKVILEADKSRELTYSSKKAPALLPTVIVDSPGELSSREKYAWGIGGSLGAATGFMAPIVAFGYGLHGQVGLPLAVASGVLVTSGFGLVATGALGGIAGFGLTYLAGTVPIHVTRQCMRTFHRMKNANRPVFSIGLLDRHAADSSWLDEVQALYAKAQAVTQTLSPLEQAEIDLNELKSNANLKKRQLKMRVEKLKIEQIQQFPSGTAKEREITSNTRRNRFLASLPWGRAFAHFFQLTPEQRSRRLQMRKEVLQRQEDLAQARIQRNYIKAVEEKVSCRKPIGLLGRIANLFRSNRPEERPFL
jgi:hypothetical protein